MLVSSVSGPGLSAYNALSCACREMDQGHQVILGLVGAWRGPTEEWGFSLE